MLWNWSLSTILDTRIWKELFSITRKLTTNKAQLFYYFAAFLQYPVVTSENAKNISKALFICHASNKCSLLTLYKHKLFFLLNVVIITYFFIYCVPDQVPHPSSTENPCYRHYKIGSRLPSPIVHPFLYSSP